MKRAARARSSRDENEDERHGMGDKTIMRKGTVGEFDSRLIVSLQKHTTITAVAKDLGVSRTTVYNHLENPEVRRARANLQKRNFRSTNDKLIEGSDCAVECLIEIVNDAEISPTNRVSAAKTILEMAYRAIGIEEFENRMIEVERALGIGEGDLDATVN